MSRRSVAIGFAASVALCFWCYLSDHVIRSGALVGDLMPVVVYGGLVAFVVCVVPLVRLGRPSLELHGRDLAIVVALFLAACGVPGRFVQCLPGSIMLPYHDARLRPGWRQERVLDYVPERILPDISVDQSRRLNGFVTGLAEGDHHIAFGDVPWAAWRRPLLFWVPLLLCLLAASLGLAAVFHRQWAHHEQLPYPISIFAHSLIEPSRAVYRSRLFWGGFLFVLLIELNNYACGWWPNVFIPVSLRFDFSGLAPLFPTLIKGKGMSLFYPRVLFPVVGLAYFLGSDICLSMVVGPIIYCFIAGVFQTYGVELRPGREMALSIELFLYSGGYFGILMMVFYTGRHFYWHVLARSLGRRTGETVPDYAVWGMRVVMIAVPGGVLLLALAGLNPFLGAAYLGLALMVFAVVSRIAAETGIFNIGTFVFPGVVLWGWLGETCLGPQRLVTMLVLSAVLMLGPRTAPLPLVAQAIKLVDLSGVDVGRFVKVTLALVVLCLAVALPVTLYWQYDRGTPSYGWPRVVATYPFENTVEAVHRLKAQGRFERAVGPRGLGRLADVSPSWSHVTAFLVAASLAITFGIGRLLFTHWPLHPVIFLFLGGYAAMHMTCSFFLGWLIKVGATKYGGARIYQRLKPLMIGLIAGAMLGKLVPMVVGTLRYLLLGKAA